MLLLRFVVQRLLLFHSGSVVHFTNRLSSSQLKPVHMFTIIFCCCSWKNRTESRTKQWFYMQLIPIPMLLWNSKREYIHDGDVRSDSNHRWENHIEIYLYIWTYKRVCCVCVFFLFCINHNNWIIGRCDGVTRQLS